jgi:mannose-1-phosphate guanylyltransferase
MSDIRIFPVILAGGASSRLWPASGRDKPKWDLRLFGPKDRSGKTQSMLEGAWERARAVAPASDCFVVSGGPQAELIRKCLPDLPAENLLVEPEPRDTSGAVAYAAGGILKKVKSAPKSEKHVMFVLPGDHIIQPVARFAQCAQAGARAAVELDSLVTFGIVPRKPATGYGYIHRGDGVSLAGAPAGSPAVYRVKEFREKPDAQTAQQYVASGEYFWNGGIFLWQLSTLMSEMQKQIPGHAEMASALAASANAAAWDSEARRCFPTLKKISIDFGIMEHARSVATVAADFDWDDIGSWGAVAEHLGANVENAVEASTQLINIDARGNLVFAPGKRVALVGVEGLAVIEADGQILICRLDRDQDVKKVSESAGKMDKPSGRNSP